MAAYCETMTDGGQTMIRDTQTTIRGGDTMTGGG